MDGRERVALTMNHEKTDRIPTSFRAEPPTANRIKKELGLTTDEFIEKYDVDMLMIDSIPPAEKFDGKAYQNLWGERYIYKETEYGPMREDKPGALNDAETLEEVMAFNWPSNDDVDYSQLKGLCEKYSKHSLVYGSADIWQRPALVRGLENFLVDMYDEPEICHWMSNRFAEYYIEDYRRAFEISGGRIDLFCVISDLGSQRGPLISLNSYEEFVSPYLKRINDAIHEMGAKVWYHCCGKMDAFIPNLIRDGVDMLDPMQPVHEDMSPESLAKRFGNQVCFHGGLDTQQLLPKGTPEDVRAAVQRYRRAFGGTGYVCAGAHLYQPDTPSANIAALYEEVLQPTGD